MTDIVEVYTRLPYVTECDSVSSTVLWRNLSLNVDWMRNLMSKDTNCSGLQQKSECQDEQSRDPPPVGVDLCQTPTGGVTGAPGETRTHNHLIRRTPGAFPQPTYSRYTSYCGLYSHQWEAQNSFFPHNLHTFHTHCSHIAASAFTEIHIGAVI